MADQRWVGTVAAALAVGLVGLPAARAEPPSTPAAAEPAAGAPRARVLVALEGPGLAAADVETLGRTLRAAVATQGGVEVLAPADVAGEVALHPAAAARRARLEEARAVLETALTRYRAFDYTGALAALERARATCLLAATVATCRPLLVTSFVHEAMALLGRDGALGAAGLAAVAQAAALDPDAALDPALVRPEVVDAFARARDAKLVSLAVASPAEGGVMFIDGRTRVDLPAHEVWVGAGPHYVELMRVGAARAVVRATAPGAAPLRLASAPSDPASAAADLTETLAAGVAPRTSAEAAAVAHWARLDRIVLVRAGHPTPAGAVPLGVTVLYSGGGGGEGAAAPEAVTLAGVAANPGEAWARAVAGPPRPAPALAPAAGGTAAAPKRGIASWAWVTIGAAGTLTTIILLVILAPPSSAVVVWDGAR
ncbi:MAG TPA: hypothetical protein VG389_17325 [Myxococcota bacterium]|nr:hypothetical protein [Myxococcota bacterium]